MNKIGIISMQRVVNHGSFLQAYGLKKTIEDNIENAKCEFIDLPTTREENVTDGKRPLIDRVKYWYHRVLHHEKVCMEYEAHWNYVKYKRIYADSIASYLAIEKVPNHKTNYDTVVIGSDEVFNCTQDNAPWFKSMFLFGGGVASKNIISYAGSFGYTTIERLREYKLEQPVKSNLNHFAAISVRDNNSKEIVEELTGKTPYCHLDPVLIYDFEKEVVEPKRGKMIVVYQYPHRIKEKKYIEMIRKLAKSGGYKIVSVFGHCDWADENLVLTPFEAMGYIKKADYVVTDTFHGCIMSIKFNKKFLAFSRSSNRQKLVDLMERFCVESQIVTEQNENLENILENKIDWSYANNKLAKERGETIAYLKKYIV